VNHAAPKGYDLCPGWKTLPKFYLPLTVLRSWEAISWKLAGLRAPKGTKEHQKAPKFNFCVRSLQSPREHAFSARDAGRVLEATVARLKEVEPEARLGLSSALASLGQESSGRANLV
jgi:hypothetical protein